MLSLGNTQNPGSDQSTKTEESEKTDVQAGTSPKTGDYVPAIPVLVLVISLTALLTEAKMLRRKSER